MRTILHADLNNFYASVECQNNPEIRDKPVAVIGDVESRHGIILAKNNIAKALGIKTGQVIWEAKKLCPGLITVGARFGLYLKYSRMVRNIYSDYTDRVEAFGIDECWLDTTESEHLFGTGENIADTIRARVKSETGLTVSVGVSWNKIFAKLASDLKKPDATVIINKDNYQEIAWPLPVQDLLYVGRATQRKLNSINIKSISQLAQADKRLLEAKLGKWGIYLNIFANGLDTTPVARTDESTIIKSVGNSITNYRDLTNDEDIKILIYLITESITARCREMGIYKIRTVHIWVRDSNLLSYGKQGKLPLPSLLTNEIADFAMQLFKTSYGWRAPVRAIGVSVSDFLKANNEQLDMVRDEKQYAKKVRLENTLDHIKSNYGPQSIQRAIILQDEKLAATDIKSEHTIHPENYFRRKEND